MAERIYLDMQLTFLGGAGLGARFGVSYIDCVIFDDELDACADPFVVTFVIVVDTDLRTADDGRDGGRSFFCGLAGVSLSTKKKLENYFKFFAFLLPSLHLCVLGISYCLV